jgi:hypothetical protein
MRLIKTTSKMDTKRRGDGRLAVCESFFDARPAISEAKLLLIEDEKVAERVYHDVHFRYRSELRCASGTLINR